MPLLRGKSIAMRPLFLLPFTLCFASPIAAQQNHNDACSNALVIPVSSTNAHSAWALAHMYDAANAVSPASCSGNGFHDVWFRFTAAATTHYVIYEGPGASVARVEVFSGSCGSLSSLACGTSNDFLTVPTLMIGTEYYLRTYGPTSTWAEAYINVAVVSAPPNDECPGAIILPVEAASGNLFPSHQGSTVGATQSSLGCWATAQADSDDDVWFGFVATGAAHSIVLDPPQGLSLQVVGGTCASPTSVLCKQTTPGKEVVTGLSAGSTYRFRIYSTGSLATVRKRFLVSVFAMAANDECAGALPISVSPADGPQEPILLPSGAATQSAQPGGCTPILHDAWYSFVAPSSSVYFRDASGTAYFGLYEGNCGSLSCIFSHDQSPAVATSLVPGNTYYLAVGDDNAPENMQFFVRAVATNDECVSAINLPVQADPSQAQWTMVDSHYATQSLPACSGAANSSDDDVWFSFTATAATHTAHMLEVQDSGNLRMELFSSTCGSLTSVQCSTIGANTAMNGLTIGATYYLRVYDSSQSLAARLVARIAITAPAANEECAGAINLVPGSLSDYASTEKVITVPGVTSLPGCSGNADDDRWYTFTATGTSAAFVAHPDAVSSFSVELFSGVCGALTSVDCRSGLAVGRMRVHYENLQPGTTYYLRVYTGTTVSGTFTPLFFGPPANDEISGAVQLSASASTFATPTTQHWTYGASRSYGRMCGTVGTPDDDVWFRFIATGATHTINAQRYNGEFLEDLPSSAMRIEAYAGFHTDSVDLQSNVLGCGANTLVLSGLAAGDTIYFRVYSEISAYDGIFGFRPSVSAGSNDDAPGAMPLSFTNSWSASFNTNGATQSQAPANCVITDFSDDDIWFKFAAGNSPGRIIVGYATEDLTLELFSGTPGSLASIACGDNMLVLPTNLANGQTYYFRLYSWDNATAVSGRIGLWTDPSLTANSCVDETCLGPVLLANPGIEQGDLCAAVFTHQGYTTYGTEVAPGWWHAGGGSADSFSSCATYNATEEVPASGVGTISDRVLVTRRGTGMGGMYVYYTGDYREYLQARLTEPLIPGVPYLVSFNMAGHLTEQATDGMGALLTTGPVQQFSGTSTLPVIPQVMSPGLIQGENWTTICNVIVPSEPLEYITIGSFLSNVQSAATGTGSDYYFIDDVVVARVIDTGCLTGVEEEGDPAFAESGTNGDGLRVYPNPANDLLNISIEQALVGERAVIEWFDATGKRVEARSVASLTANLLVDVPAAMKEGLYLVMLSVEGEAPRSARVIVRR